MTVWWISSKSLSNPLRRTFPMPATYKNASLEPLFSTKAQDPPATMQAGPFIYLYLFIHLYYIKKIYLSVGIISYQNDFVNPSFDYQRLSTIERLSRATMPRLSTISPTFPTMPGDYQATFRMFSAPPAASCAHQTSDRPSRRCAAGRSVGPVPGVAEREDPRRTSRAGAIVSDLTAIEPPQHAP